MKRRRSNWLPSIPNCDQWNLPVVNRWWPQKLPECIVCDGRKNVLKSDSAPSYRLFFPPTVITSTFAVFRNEVVLAFLLISTFFLSCCYSCFIPPQRQIMGSLWQKPNWSPLTPPKDSGSTGPCKKLKQDKQANKNCFYWGRDSFLTKYRLLCKAIYYYHLLFQLFQLEFCFL